MKLLREKVKKNILPFEDGAVYWVLSSDHEYTRYWLHMTPEFPTRIISYLSFNAFWVATSSVQPKEHFKYTHAGHIPFVVVRDEEIEKYIPDYKDVLSGFRK